MFEVMDFVENWTKRIGARRFALRVKSRPGMCGKMGVNR